MKKFIAILLSFMLIISLTACSGETQPTPDNTPEPTPTPTPAVEKVETVVEITEENFNEYFKLVKIEHPTDTFGEPITERDCYVVTSNVYDKGLIYYGAKDAAIKLVSKSVSVTHEGGFIVTLRCNKGDTVEVSRLKGSAIFINSDFVESVSFQGMDREMTLKDGKKRGMSPGGGFTFSEELPY